MRRAIIFLGLLILLTVVNARGLRPRDFPNMSFSKYGLTDDNMSQVVCNSKTCNGIGSNINCVYISTNMLNGYENDMFHCTSVNREGWTIDSHKIICKGLRSPIDMDIVSKESCQIHITAAYNGMSVDSVSSEEIFAVFVVCAIVLILVVGIVVKCNTPSRSYIHSNDMYYNNDDSDDLMRSILCFELCCRNNSTVSSSVGGSGRR